MVWSLWTRLDGLVCKLQGPGCLCLPSTGITDVCHHAQLLYEFWGFNSGLALYQLNPLCGPKCIVMDSLPCGAWLSVYFPLWVSSPRYGLGQSRRCGFPLPVAQRWLSLQSPLLSAGADLLSTLCRHGFLPIPLLIGLHFCHRNAKRCRNMSALKSLQPFLLPKQPKNTDLSASDCGCAT